MEVDLHLKQIVLFGVLQPRVRALDGSVRNEDVRLARRSHETGGGVRLGKVHGGLDGRRRDGKDFAERRIERPRLA